MRIHLALSGGGKRATLFHLGVLRYFAEAGILGSVEVATSVSGGSILLAHALLHWEDYLDARTGDGVEDRFFTRAGEVIAFCRHPTRERILRSTPYLPLRRAMQRKPLQRFRYTTLGLLAANYDTLLYKNATIGALGGPVHGIARPRPMILSTNVSTLALAYFSQAGLQPAIMDGESPAVIPCSTLPLSIAVAASSAFPGLFGALELSPELLGTSLKQLRLELQSFADGGIFDNLGIRGIEYAQRQDSAGGRERPDFVVVSDAGRESDWQTRIASPAFMNLPLRANDVVMARVGEFERGRAAGVHTPGRLLFLSMNPGATLPASSVGLTFPDKGSAEANLLALGGMLAKVRTDLDAFDSVEVRALVQYGYLIAAINIGTRLKQIGLHPPGLAPWNPFTGAHGAVQVSPSEEVQLRSASERKAHWTRLILHWPHVVTVAVVVLTVAIVSYLSAKHAMEENERAMEQNISRQMGRLSSLAEGSAFSLEEVIITRKGTHGFPGSRGQDETWTTSQCVAALCQRESLDDGVLEEYVGMLEKRFTADDYHADGMGWTSDTFVDAGGAFRVHVVPGLWLYIALSSAKAVDDGTSGRLQQAKLIELRNRLLTVLASYQTASGGWSFYPASDEPSVFATCYALLGMLLGAEAGLYIGASSEENRAAIEAAARWLEGQQLTGETPGWTELGQASREPLIGLSLHVAFVLLKATETGYVLAENTKKTIGELVGVNLVAVNLTGVDAAKYQGWAVHFARFPWALAAKAAHVRWLCQERGTVAGVAAEVDELFELIAQGRMPTLRDRTNTYRFALGLFALRQLQRELKGINVSLDGERK